MKKQRFPLTFLGIMVALPVVLALAYMLVQLTVRTFEFFVHAPDGLVVVVLVLVAGGVRAVLPLRPEHD